MSDLSAPPVHSDVLEAEQRIRGVLNVTPLTLSPDFSVGPQRQVFMKWENRHKTGSFKERGAVNVLHSLTPAERRDGVCAASAGNHALALSYHAGLLGVPCTIVMPKQAPLVKIRRTERTGATVILFGDTFDEAYDHALKLAAEQGASFVSAFDDRRIVAGQGTAGLEILQQCPDVDSVIVPVGGGGLASGIALAMKAVKPDLFVLGVQSEWVRQMRERLSSTPAPLIAPATIADGIAVKRIGKVTGPLIASIIDSLVTVSEPEIAAAVVRFLEFERTMVEGAGAAALAALLARQLPERFRRTVVVVSGSNIDMNVLSRLIERDMGQAGRVIRVTVAVPDRPGSLHMITGLLAQSGANVLEVYHDRSLSAFPGNVNISFVLEVRDSTHKVEVLEYIRRAGLEAREL